MQTTSDLHRLICKVRFGIAKDIFHDAASFHAPNHMLNQNTNTRYDLVLCFFFFGELFPFGLFLRLMDADIVRVVALKPGVLEQPNAWRKDEVFFITNTFVVG